QARAAGTFCEVHPLAPSHEIRGKSRPGSGRSNWATIPSANAGHAAIREGAFSSRRQGGGACVEKSATAHPLSPRLPSLPPGQSLLANEVVGCFFHPRSRKEVPPWNHAKQRSRARSPGRRPRRPSRTASALSSWRNASHRVIGALTAVRNVTPSHLD